MSQEIGIGAVVRWTSMGGGVSKTKTGVVRRFVSAGEVPTISDGRPRDHESYLVAVREGRRTRFYWPRVKGLELVRPAAENTPSPALEEARTRRDGATP